MEELTDKSYKSYSYISRYTSFPYYYNTDDKKYIYGLTSNLDNTTAFIVHNVKNGDSFDSLSNRYYGRPDLYWVIADYNRVQDCFIDLSKKFTTIKIPTLRDVKYIKR